MEITEMDELDAIEKSFGTPSAQKLIPFLVCWDNLSAKQLSKFTNLSESQVHATLQTLIKVNIIQRESRGNYQLTSTKFAQALKSAYQGKIEQVLGKFMYNLSSHLDDLSPDEITQKISYMTEQWKPILEELYRSKLTSIAEYVIDRYTNDKK